MDITFVGCGDAVGSGGRFQTCIQLQHEGYTALVDCGATSLTAFHAHGLDPHQVDAVVISHLHGDHFGGLPLLIRGEECTGRTRPLTVLGPAGTEARLHTAMEVFYPGTLSAPRNFDLQVIELPGDGSSHRTGALTVRSWDVEHPSGAPSLAVQVTLGGRVFGYSGATAWTAALVDAAYGTDVFACEAYTYHQPVPYHLDYATVAEHAAEFATDLLILTHLGPTVLANLHRLAHATAYDGMRLMV